MVIGFPVILVVMSVLIHVPVCRLEWVRRDGAWLVYHSCTCQHLLRAPFSVSLRPGEQRVGTDALAELLGIIGLNDPECQKSAVTFFIPLRQQDIAEQLGKIST